jgi:hypothetical protein
MGAMGAVEGAGMGKDVEAVGEPGEESFLMNAFFSFARLFWNHTCSREVGDASGVRFFFSEVERG